MRVFGVSSLLLADCVFAARVKNIVQSRLDSISDVLLMSQSVSMANGFLNMTGFLDAEVNKNCGQIWPTSLDSKFTGKFVVGSGATACVWLAKDDTDTLVAVKVGKGSNGKSNEATLKSWQMECNDMQYMRLKGCRAGEEVLQLHEQYLPTCTEVGPTEKGAYYVMHAAGVTPIRDIDDLGLSKSDKVSVFSGLVTSIYALHAVDLTHNDLHGQNIVMDKTQLALIDFGSLKTLERGWKKDYKRDDNAIWRWGAVLAGCEAGAQWPNPPTSTAGQKFLACMKTFSDGDATFMAALKKMVAASVKESDNYYATEVYQSNFIQKNKPASQTYYPWTGSKGCLSYNAEKWAEVDFSMTFSGYLKCDTIPTYKQITRKEKKGKVRVKETIMCQGMQDKGSACWSNRPGMVWACGGCATGVVSQDFDGGCLFPSHPGYKHAGTYVQ